MRSDVRAITLFAQSFPSLLRSPQALASAVIETHLAHLATRYPAPKTRTCYIGAVAGLLRTVRQHGWEPGLDPHLDLYREDYPRLNQSQPRALSEAVMAQVEHANKSIRPCVPIGSGGRPMLANWQQLARIANAKDPYGRACPVRSGYDCAPR